MSRRQARVREAPIPENMAKLQLAEAKMQELKANMAVLGKEATAALAAVESQQHRLTFQRLVAMVCLIFLCTQRFFGLYDDYCFYFIAYSTQGRRRKELSSKNSRSTQ